MSDTTSNKWVGLKKLSRRTTTVRTFWKGGKFFGMSDAGAFLGKAKEVPIIPGALPLALEASNRFVTLDFAASRSAHVSFRSAHGGTIKELVFNTNSGEAVVEKTR